MELKLAKREEVERWLDAARTKASDVRSFLGRGELVLADRGMMVLQSYLQNLSDALKIK